MFQKAMDRLLTPGILPLIVFFPCAFLIGRNAYIQISMGWMPAWASLGSSLLMLAFLVAGLRFGATLADEEDD